MKGEKKKPKSAGESPSRSSGIEAELVSEVRKDETMYPNDSGAIM